MSKNDSGRVRRWAATLVGALALASALPLAVLASHSFSDVPDSNEFHGSIEWMKNNGVTIGCNPPANTEFCPTDNVTREQMASFMRRFAQTQGSAGVDITDDANPVTITDATPVELLSVDVNPKAEASVVLNAHVTLERPTSAEAEYRLFIAQGTCSGAVIATTEWTATAQTAASPSIRTSLALTGSDTVTADTTYVFCAVETVETTAATEALAIQRGLNAAWDPTA